ncbi:MAG: hypothetical protein ACRDJ5_01265, partial [Actinomycetota bacterium]
QGLAAGDSIEITSVAQAGPSLTLIGGIIAALVLAAALLVPLLMRRAGRRSRPATSARGSEPSSRQALLVEIAQLDIDRETGNIPDEEWDRSRARLKARLGELTPREPVP